MRRCAVGDRAIRPCRARICRQIEEQPAVADAWQGRRCKAVHQVPAQDGLTIGIHSRGREIACNRKAVRMQRKVTVRQREAESIAAVPLQQQYAAERRPGAPAKRPHQNIHRIDAYYVGPLNYFAWIQPAAGGPTPNGDGFRSVLVASMTAHDCRLTFVQAVAGTGDGQLQALLQRYHAPAFHCGQQPVRHLAVGLQALAHGPHCTGPVIGQFQRIGAGVRLRGIEPSNLKTCSSA